MVTIEGKWRMEGLDREDSNRIKTSSELSEVIEELGFLPLFKNNISGFSVEEMTAADCWWAGTPEEDPWEWREVIANEGRIAYGKFFCNRAGFISREWFPYFAAYRRDGYDFDSRYEDGLASRKHKKLMDLLELSASMPSYELKKYAGFCKEGETGFEGTVTALQMQTYIIVNGFHRRRNRRNEEYGWSVAEYALSERRFGEEYVRSAYGMGTAEAKCRIMARLQKNFPHASELEAEKLIR